VRFLTREVFNPNAKLELLYRGSSSSRRTLFILTWVLLKKGVCCYNKEALVLLPLPLGLVYSSSNNNNNKHPW